MEQTYGQLLVRRSFNPSASKKVEDLKQKHADIIDQLHAMREGAMGMELTGTARTISIAITKVEEACMWAVNAATA